jgi:hypothetical protein
MLHKRTLLARRAVMLTPLLLLAACGQPADDPGLGGLSHSEASQLNDAAAMLDANSVSVNAVTNTQEPNP